MWLWLLTQTALQQSLVPVDNLFLGETAVAAETSVGPTSTEEADLLWTDGEAAFKSQDYSQTIVLLQRLVDRYPGFPGYLEAHRDLGRAYMCTNQAEKSLAPLQYYISSTGDRALSLRARIWLGQANLALGRAHEAYLSAIEIEKSKDPGEIVFSESQILKARALLALSEDERAERTLDAVKEKVAVQADPELKGQTELVVLELKVRECSKLPDLKTTHFMEELETRDTYSKRALCLQEAMLAFKDAIQSGAKAKDSLQLDQAQKLLLLGFEQYNNAVLHPPGPPQKSKFSAKQRKQYLLELSDILDQDRSRTYQQALVTLASWKRRSSSWLSAIYQTLIAELQKLSSGSDS